MRSYTIFVWGRWGTVDVFEGLYKRGVAFLKDVVNRTFNDIYNPLPKAFYYKFIYFYAYGSYNMGRIRDLQRHIGI